MPEERITIGNDEFVRISRYGVIADHPEALEGDRYYFHEQAQASSVWTVAHGLNKHVAVTVMDTSGNEVRGRVIHLDSNTVRVEFSTLVSGTMSCN